MITIFFSQPGEKKERPDIHVYLALPLARWTFGDLITSSVKWRAWIK